MNEQSVLVELDQIRDNPYQMRVDYDAEKIKELAVDIHSNTLLQVPAARRVNGHYELVYGHRRKRAYELLASVGVPDLGIEPDQKFKFMPLYVREMDDFQMFDDGLSENIKRDDLKPTERARAIQKYLDFGKTSKEAAVKFGLGSDATVRGLVRLLDLPEAAQQSLDEGKITQGTARELLSLQKIAPEKVVVSTIKQIEKGQDRWGNAETPEDAIENALNGLDEVVDMWNDGRDGKPRAGMHYGRGGDLWLLDMKNFPNKLLPQLTPVDAAIALGVQDNPGACATLGTWINEEIEYRGHDVASADFSFLNGRLTVDQIERLKLLLNPPACTACPFYTKVRRRHYCGLKACHTRKTQAWHVNTIQAASKDLGIPIWSEEDGKYQVLDGYGDHEKLFKLRNKDLRLIEKAKIRGYHYQSWPGVKDDVFMVVMTGKTLQNKTEAVKEAKAEEKTQRSVKDQQEDLRMDKEKLLEWEATLYIKTLFDGLNSQALDAFVSAPYGWGLDESDVPEGCQPGNDATDAVKADFDRRLIALNMLNEVEDDINPSNMTVSEYANWLIETTQGWGVKLPKSIQKMAEQFDAEIAAVSVETPVKKGKKS